MKINNFILIGFDRSGTSAISKILAKHPQVELVYRPFNSGPIRKKMYKIMNDGIASDADINFFTKLGNNSFDESYIVSDWHKKYSTIKHDFKNGKLHVLITNLNHFSTRWVNDKFPNIEQWAIWRDPIEILNSCVKNDFYSSWYDDALNQVFTSVKEDSDLSKHFESFIKDINNSNDVIKTAFLIAVRNYFLFKNVDRQKIIVYENFKENPNEALQKLIAYFNLNDNFDFSPYLEIDLNTIPSADGYERNKKGKFVLKDDDVEMAKLLFRPLYDLKNNFIND